jgi:hypothetical protein
MKHPLASLAAFVLLISISRCARSEAPAQVLVLHNGNVLQGKLEHGNHGWTVTNGPWYTIQVPARDVDFVAASLQQAYRTKLSRLRPRAFDEHLRLAQWCLRHDMDGPAADRLLHLVELNPQHPAVKALEHQLRRRANPQQVRVDEVRAANFTADIDSADERAPSDATSLADLPPLPPSAIGEFTRAVQPLLLNRCGQATCHGTASKNEFQLVGNPRQLMRKDLTWRNLRAVLAHVDPDDPDQSRLLEQAHTIHGSAKRSPLETHELRPRQTLRDWVRSVAHATTASDPLPTSDPEMATAPATTSDTMFDAPRTIPPISAAPVPSASAASQSIDPFDPAEFNARLDD